MGLTLPSLRRTGNLRNQRSALVPVRTSHCLLSTLTPDIELLRSGYDGDKFGGMWF